jgi:hypothetical protein
MGEELGNQGAEEQRGSTAGKRQPSALLRHGKVHGCGQRPGLRRSARRAKCMQVGLSDMAAADVRLSAALAATSGPPAPRTRVTLRAP